MSKRRNPSRKHQVRVIAGEYRGRWLRYPSGADLRPTMQRIKSSVFESLSTRVRGSVFLDLYAAAGGIGIEALSRGAQRVHFVEQNATAASLITENLEKLGVPADRYLVHATSVLDFLERGGFQAARPSIVYADPPYAARDTELLLEFFAGLDYSETHIILLEHESDLSVPHVDTFRRTKQRKFGQSRVSYFIAGAGEF